MLALGLGPTDDYKWMATNSQTHGQPSKLYPLELPMVGSVQTKPGSLDELLLI